MTDSQPQPKSRDNQAVEPAANRAHPPENKTAKKNPREDAKVKSRWTSEGGKS